MRGFTLLELMVVVLLISILAIIATPMMATARNDRLVWDYARQYQGLVHRATSHAAGRGAAQLVLLGPGPQARGWARQFEALDAELPANGGPNPVSSCKNVIQWADAIVDPPVSPSNRARYIDWLDLNSTGVNKDMDVKTTLFMGDSTAQTAIPVLFLAICVTPSGTRYVGGGGTAIAAVTQMRDSPAFNDVAEIDIQRNKAGAGIGLRRRVMVVGSAAPRLRAD